MTSTSREPRAGYAYHLMRCAAERYGRDVSALNESELEVARTQAARTHALESMVFGSEEAQRVSVEAERVESAVASLVSRYPSHEEFESGLQANGLDEAELREALRRELWFDRVMAAVAADLPTVTKVDALRYYETHIDRFVVPERRAARHILVTINHAVAENHRDVARRRIDQLATSLASEPRRFTELAKRHSECPSALDGGKLGEVARGRLYPALERVLFRMQEGSISEVVETELGYHLLQLDKCFPSHVVPFSVVEDRIRGALDGRQRRKRQEAFLERLKTGGGDR